MMQCCPRRFLVALPMALAAFAQEPPASPRFDSAVIEPATLSRTGPRHRVDASRVEFLGTSLAQLIRTAYRLEPYQNVTGPDWMRRAYFDVFATLPQGAARDRIPEMLQALLAGELKLVLRRTSVMEPVCVLSTGKNGPKLKPPQTDTTLNAFLTRMGRRAPLRMQTSAEGYVTYSRVNGSVILDASRISLAELTALLRREIGRPVFDHTGLQGLYEISLFVPGGWLTPANRRGDIQDAGDSAPPDPQALLLASEPQGVNLYKSIQRLGLKLEKSKAPIEHFVVESAELHPVTR
ncbi:MAG TPA: TIGR03435 family protein [Candidatus Limnocylindrales bacterium]|nr:TIGR03435 family protein [Candidatus Limnocylindrales bacterium]